MASIFVPEWSRNFPSRGALFEIINRSSSLELLPFRIRGQTHGLQFGKRFIHKVKVNLQKVAKEIGYKKQHTVYQKHHIIKKNAGSPSHPQQRINRQKRNVPFCQTSP
jgi:hypothetical protein